MSAQEPMLTCDDDRRRLSDAQHGSRLGRQRIEIHRRRCCCCCCCCASAAQDDAFHARDAHLPVQVGYGGHQRRAGRSAAFDHARGQKLQESIKRQASHRTYHWTVKLQIAVAGAKRGSMAAQEKQTVGILYKGSPLLPLSDRRLALRWIRFLGLSFALHITIDARLKLASLSRHAA